MATYTSTMISRGRTQLPRELMEAHDLKPGDQLIFSNNETGDILMRKATEAEILEKTARGARRNK